MSKPSMDIDMVSPPNSPRASSSSLDEPSSSSHPRSSPVPITPKSHKTSSRFQPSVRKSSSPPFNPPLAYHQSIFKPKALHSHTSRPLHPAATNDSLQASISASQKTTIPSSPHPFHPQSIALHSHRLSSPHSEPHTDLTRTGPLHIPQSHPNISTPSSQSPPLATSATASNFYSASLPHRANSPLPHFLPSLSPSYPATLFGGLSADDEHVTVWEPSNGKTVAGNAAPYRRNLAAWLEAHPGWEEKADELKSSKRRSAARRARAAADAFAAMCCYPVATLLTNQAASYLKALGDGDHCNETAMMMWSSDDFVRLQEALFRLAQEVHAQESEQVELDQSKWAQVTTQVGGSKMQGTVVYCAHHMLTRGIAKSQREMVANGAMPKSLAVANGNHTAELPIVGSPGSASSHDIGGAGMLDAVGPRSLPAIQVGLGASFLERSFRAPREPRVTVWNPSNGRTISGNAAPCRRNLEAWMRQHPGWYPKEEGQLSSSRRNRNRSSGKFRPSSMPAAPEIVPSTLEPESPHFHDALEGLLCLSRSPSVGVSPPNSLTVDAQLEEQVARVEAEIRNGAAMSRMESVQEMENEEREAKKLVVTSSVSSSSVEDGEVSDVDVMETSKMEL